MHRLLLVALSLLGLAASARAEDPLDRLRSRLGPLRDSLEEIRGEKLTREVKVELAPVETASVGTSASNGREAHRTRALEKLGILPPARPRRRRHPGASVEMATEGQTLAWYEPAARTLYVVKHGGALEASLDSTAIHELDHALEDERFDLTAYFASARGADPIATNDDAALARKIVAEGEATYVAASWDAKRRKRLDKLDESLEKRATLSRTDRAQILREQAASLGDKGVVRAIEAEEALPLYLYRGLVDPYVQGPAIVARAIKRGGWAAVDDLYRHPPLSTRELFHLEKRGAARDELALPDPAPLLGNGFERVLETTLGEVGVVAFLEARVASKRGAPGARLAASVTNDRLVSCENAAGDVCVAWLLAGETEDAARDLEIASREAVRNETSAGGEPVIERRGRRVLLVLGAPRVNAKALVEATLPAK